jgi:hypothetical protein
VDGLENLVPGGGMFLPKTEPFEERSDRENVSFPGEQIQIRHRPIACIVNAE